jgi:hypothetical protein
VVSADLGPARKYPAIGADVSLMPVKELTIQIQLI